MIHFFELLSLRNEPLFIFGCLNMLAAFVFILLSRFSELRVREANAWLKPFKFAVSIAVFSWTMGWFAFELNAPATINFYNQATIGLLGFEIVYISLQAGRGTTSHHNTSTPLYSFLAIFMGVAAVAVTLHTAYIGWLFFTGSFPGLPAYYLLSIRMGIVLFVFFALQGATMGQRQTHTVGGPEGVSSVPVLNWSTKYGDLRIAHFFGMHALQVLPLLSWYLVRNSEAMLLIGFLYALFTVLTFFSALKGYTVKAYLVRLFR